MENVCAPGLVLDSPYGLGGQAWTRRSVRLPRASEGDEGTVSRVSRHVRGMFTQKKGMKKTLSRNDTTTLKKKVVD
jgi:hypothetical protein